MEEAHGSSGALALVLALSGTWLHGSLIPLLSLHVTCHMKVTFASGKSKRFDCLRLADVHHDVTLHKGVWCLCWELQIY